MRAIRRPIILLAFCLAIHVAAQDPPPDYQPFSMDDLQQLVAPIALYPDALLAQTLAAATYPDQVIDAARWLDATIPITPRPNRGTPPSRASPITPPSSITWPPTPTG